MKEIKSVPISDFQPRSYQIPLFKAMEKKGLKRAVLVWHRRAGKDVTAFNFMIRAALREVGSYYYMLPTYNQARRIIFEGMTITGKKFLDYIPSEFVKDVNIAQMKITLSNNSIIYFLGSERYDSLRGTNAKGMIFSEYAYQHPNVYPTLRPVLVANDGWAIFISTPFGENHFYKIYQVAENSEDWFLQTLTVDDTSIVSKEMIQAELEEGIMSPDMIQQEYYCSFSVGALGSYYSHYLNDMELNNQITNVPWDPSHMVHTAWDLGMRDTTVIIFFQVIGNAIYIIDLYHNSDVGLEHYIHLVKNKPYQYGKHIAPHDIKVREFTSGGLSRFEKANSLGIKFTIAPHLSIIDGIETVRTTLPRTYIDQTKCKRLISAIRDYRKEYNSKTKTYDQKPFHDDNSNYADALRYMCLSLGKLKAGSTPEQLEQRYREARYGAEAQLPRPFQSVEYL